MKTQVSFWAATLLVLAAAAASCSDGGVVGGRCRYAGCAESSAGGAAGDAAGADGPGGDAPADQLSGNDALHPEADAPVSDGDAAAPDSGDLDASDSDTGDSQCAPPYDTPAHCGNCATQCVGASPLCALVDGGYACVPACSPPLTFCAGTCVNLANDPDHCGACGNACPSGLCQAGQCVGASAGHVVLLCSSFEQNQQSAPQTALLGNAVFLPAGNPVRVLAYGEWAPNSIQNKVKQALGWSASAKGRSFALTPVASSAGVPGLLDKSSFDVFLVYDQTVAPAGALAVAGTAWKSTLATFVAQGGVVVVASGGGGTGEMSALIANAGLLAITSQTNVTGQVLFNQAPSDAVGLNVLSPFLALNRTCTFVTSDKPGGPITFVVSGSADGGAAPPVVVHRVQ